MSDVLFDGLPVIDLLEITPSTSAVARLTKLHQSSISRIYRQASRRLGLVFCKHPDGCYRAGANQPLLESLRRSSQWLRLNGTPAAPRWVAIGHAGVTITRRQPSLPPTLVERRRDPQRIQALLLERVLDLALITLPPQAIGGPQSLPGLAPEHRFGARRLVGSPDGTAELLALPMVAGPEGIDAVLLRAELRQNPAMAALIGAIEDTYRELLPERPELDGPSSRQSCSSKSKSTANR